MRHASFSSIDAELGDSRMVFCRIALTCLAAGERLSLANEPGNNTFPGGVHPPVRPSAAG